MRGMAAAEPDRALAKTWTVLRDIGLPRDGEINIVQGEDKGARSLLKAEFSTSAGEGIRVSGTTRVLETDAEDKLSPVSIRAPIKLAKGRTEADLLAISVGVANRSGGDLAAPVSRSRKWVCRRLNQAGWRTAPVWSPLFVF